VQPELQAASPHYYLARVHVPVLLLHGSTDNVVPPTETLWLEHDLPRSLARRTHLPAIACGAWRLRHNGPASADTFYERDAGVADTSSAERDKYGSDDHTGKLAGGAGALRGVVVHTPWCLLWTRKLGNHRPRSGAMPEELYLKPKAATNGSFKLRGAYNKIALLTPKARARRDYLLFGNHAQGVAYAARALGARGDRDAGALRG